MTSTMTLACPLCGLRFTARSLLELHVREDHRPPRDPAPGRAQRTSGIICAPGWKLDVQRCSVAGRAEERDCSAQCLDPVFEADDARAAAGVGAAMPSSRTESVRPPSQPSTRMSMTDACACFAALASASDAMYRRPPRGAPQAASLDSG